MKQGNTFAAKIAEDKEKKMKMKKPVKWRTYNFFLKISSVSNEDEQKKEAVEKPEVKHDMKKLKRQKQTTQTKNESL